MKRRGDRSSGRELDSALRGAVAISAVVLGLTAAGCAERGRQITLPHQETGMELYEGMCAPCHGLDGKGNGPAAAALNHPPSDLTMLSLRNDGVYPRQQVIRVLNGELSVPAHGSRQMPIWRERFELDSGATAAASIYAHRRLNLLADYIERIQGK